VVHHASRSPKFLFTFEEGGDWGVVGYSGVFFVVPNVFL
jgi:hypothetical protein